MGYLWIIFSPIIITHNYSLLFIAAKNIYVFQTISKLSK